MVTFHGIFNSFFWSVLIIHYGKVSSGAITNMDSENDVITMKHVSNLLEVKVVLDQLGHELHDLGKEVDESNEQPLPTTPTIIQRLENCKQVLESGLDISGVYEIKPYENSSIVKVYCDMEFDGGGWTAIQRRGINEMPKADRENFYRNWTEYENGFGNETDDYWIGLVNMNLLTCCDCKNELSVRLVHWNGTDEIYKYEHFKISGKEDKYRITINGYYQNGNRFDSLAGHNGVQFSTYDNDNDNSATNLAVINKGAWWFIDRFSSSLNGDYPIDGSNGVVTNGHGIRWYQPGNNGYSYKKSEMLIRPNC